MLELFDLLFNRLPFLRWLNGYKTQVAGGLAAVGAASEQLGSVIPGSTGEVLQVVGRASMEAAGAVGAWGVAGKIVKKEQDVRETEEELEQMSEENLQLRRQVLELKQTQE